MVKVKNRKAAHYIRLKTPYRGEPGFFKCLDEGLILIKRILDDEPAAKAAHHLVEIKAIEEHFAWQRGVSHLDERQQYLKMVRECKQIVSDLYKKITGADLPELYPTSKKEREAIRRNLREVNQQTIIDAYHRNDGNFLTGLLLDYVAISDS